METPQQNLSHSSSSSPTEVAAGAGPMRVIRAAWVADGAGQFFAPGVLLLDHRRVQAVGSPESIGVPGADWKSVDLLQSGVFPALVNAHAHLDLTEAGPVPPPTDFQLWLAGVRRRRTEMTAAEVDRSVATGVQHLLAGGVAAVGDIASPDGYQPALTHTTAAHLRGVVYGEVFGMASRLDAALEAVAGYAASGLAHCHGRMRGGIEPHAPYSSDWRVYEAALRTGVPVCTHLAESPEEREFLSQGTGVFRQLLDSFGLWDGHFRLGSTHPVRWMGDRLAAVPGRRILAAHFNDMTPDALDLLSHLPIDVAYCPRASEYFGHCNHSYRQMRARGINVCLGTDSALNLDTPERISPLGDLRLLMRRDGLELSVAIELATTAGAKALGLDANLFTFQRGAVAGVLAVDLAGHHAPQEFGKTSSGPQWVQPLHQD